MQNDDEMVDLLEFQRIEDDIIKKANIEIAASSLPIFLDKFKELELDNEKRYDLFCMLYDKYHNEIKIRIEKITKKKKYKQDDILCEIFMTEYLYKHEKINMRYQLVAGLNILENYSNMVVTKAPHTESEYFFERCAIRIKYIIYDLEHVVSYYEKKYLKINDGSSIHRPYYIDGRKIYTQSCQLMWNQFSTGDSDLMSLSVFSIRQSLEVLLKNALGINYIIEDNRIYKQLNVDKLIEFMSTNKSILFPVSVDVKILNKIFQWTNSYIHGGISPYHWLIEIAQEYIKPLFYHEGEFDYGIKVKKCYLNDKGLLKKELFEYLEIKESKGDIVWHKNYESQIVECQITH